MLGIDLASEGDVLFHVKLPIDPLHEVDLGGNRLELQVHQFERGFQVDLVLRHCHKGQDSAYMNPISSRTIFSPLVLVVVAALIASISATDVVSEKCPTVCFLPSQCSGCADGALCIFFVCYY